MIPWEVYDSTGNISTDKEFILNHWKSEYNKLYNNISGDYDDMFRENILNMKDHKERSMQDPLYNANINLNRPISLDEVKKVVSKAKNGKAVGMDNIPNEILKCQPIIGALHALFQLCFDSGKVPTIWTKSIISPIPKNRTNDPRVPLNYRGISLLSCVYKLYSATLNTRLIKHLEDNDILHDEQNGFRGGRSCQDHIFTLSSIIKNRINEKKSTFACYIDFRKAFDLLDRDLMLYRFLDYGVDGKFYEVIKGIYNKALCSVKINGLLTDWFETTHGTKQGDNLSPNCFSMYINPLLSELKSLGLGVQVDNTVISVLAYADDLVLIAENENDLQRLITSLQNWCHKWRLSVNIDKTKAMHFRNKNEPVTNFVFKINNLPLECVNEYKYLGIIMDQFMSFDKTAEMLSSSAGRALGAIINKVRVNKDLGFNSFTTLIENCVSPILQYSSGVWGNKKFKNCEDVILRACRFYSGVHRLTPIPGIQGDFAWLDCKSRSVLEMIRLYNRFIKMDDNRLNKRVFLWDREICKDNWSSSYKGILDDMNLGNYWLNSRIIPLDLAKDRVRERLKRDWKHQCSTKDKLRTYRIHKKDMRVASHLNCNMPKYQRSLISQLRLGVLPLRIETGRFVRLDEADRLCQVCSNNDIENEFHFLFECDEYNEYRSKLETAIGTNFSDLSAQEKFDRVFSHPHSLGRYMTLAYRKRREKLYK